MDNNHYSEFDNFLHDLRSGDDGHEPTLEEVKQHQAKIPTAADLLARHVADIDRVKERDPHAAEQSICQLRMQQELQRPIRKAEKDNVTLSGPTFSSEARAQEGDLSWALGESEPSDTPPAAIMGNNHEPEESPTMVFAKGAGGSRESFLNQPIPAVLQAVAARMPSASGRAFAEKLARAAETEGVS